MASVKMVFMNVDCIPDTFYITRIFAEGCKFKSIEPLPHQLLIKSDDSVYYLTALQDSIEWFHVNDSKTADLIY